MLRFVIDHLKTERMCNNAVKKLPFLIKYIPNQYNTNKICDKNIVEKSGLSGFIPD